MREHVVQENKTLFWIPKGDSRPDEKNDVGDGGWAEKKKQSGSEPGVGHKPSGD